MQSAGATTQDAGASSKSVSSQRAVVIYLMWGFLLTFRGIIDLRLRSSHPSQAFFLVGICLPILLGAVGFLLALFVLFGMSSLGGVEYEQISDLRVEQRVRERFGIETDQLTSLGFSYAFTSGEAMSLARVLLIFPGIVYLRMWLNGEILTRRGSKLLLAVPVFSSSDGRVFGHPNRLGTTFHTAFRNGPLLVTKNYQSVCDSCETPEIVMHASEGTITETWRIHKEWVDKLDTEAKPAMRDRGYEAYAEVVRREDAFIRSQR